MSNDLAGPYILWLDYGYEDWHPTSYPTLAAALESERYHSRFIITRAVTYQITDPTPPETPAPQPQPAKN